MPATLAADAAVPAVSMFPPVNRTQNVRGLVTRSDLPRRGATRLFTSTGSGAEVEGRTLPRYSALKLFPPIQTALFLKDSLTAVRSPCA